MAQLKHPKMVDIRDILDENTRLPALVAASAEKLLGLERLNKAYDKIVRDKESGSQENFFQLASRHLNLKLQLRPGDLENIPKKGPVVVVANHPHGLSDGIMFGGAAYPRKRGCPHPGQRAAFPVRGAGSLAHQGGRV